MFDLLKNKFKNLTDKLLGKTKEKVEEEKQSEVVEQQVEEQPIPLQEVEEKEEKISEEPKPVLKKLIIEKKSTISEPKVEKADKVKTTELEQIKSPETKEIKIPETEIIEPVENTPFLGHTEPEISEPKIIEEPILKDSKPVIVAREPSKTGSEKHSIFDIFKSKPKVQPPVERPVIKKEIERPVPTPRAEERPVPVYTPKPVSEVVVPEPKFEERPIPRTEPIEKPIFKQELTEIDSDLNVKKTTEIKKSLVTSLKGIFSSKIKLSDKEISDFLEEFELSLLEADVSIVSAENICKDLKEKLINASFSKENPLEDIKEHIRESLKAQLDIDCDINNYIDKTKKENQPFVIMFIGPNGAGKTTTISKFAHSYKQKGKSIVLASGDTFRAGSIDQLEKHATTIGVKIVKQGYGSDPAAVAFDAVTSAKSSKADYVFIDTAGRQENNINLMQELKKIKRVVTPNLTIYIGEAQAGQAIVDQVNGFEKEIGVDGVILTKLDTDPKGGVAISILNELKKPIFYVGTGQTYNDLEEFSPEFIIKRIV